MCASLLSSIFVLGFVATTAQADDDEDGTKVIWKRIVGIIEPEGIVGRPLGGADCNVGVDCVAGSLVPWTVTNGSAKVDLDQGEVKFRVRGLVVAGDPSFANIGTPSVVTKVKGTLVCNDTAPGVPELVDTKAVRLSARGNATFRGSLDLPESCTDEPEDIVFLIRIADVSEPVPLIDLWNAFGAVRILKSD
jgi:hypothetical protein